MCCSEYKLATGLCQDGQHAARQLSVCLGCMQRLYAVMLAALCEPTSAAHCDMYKSSPHLLSQTAVLYKSADSKKGPTDLKGGFV